MPEIYGTVLTKSELRDVVEYLASLKASNTPRLDGVPRALRTATVRPAPGKKRRK